MLRVRSLLYTPSNVLKMLDKAQACTAADVLVPDLEDSVPLSAKRAAREVLRPWIERAGQRRLSSARQSSLLVPRVNSLRSGLLEDDLRTVLVAGVDAVHVGKVDAAEDVVALDDAIAAIGRSCGLDDDTCDGVGLLPTVESALGVVNAHAICSASERVVGVAFGGDDFRRDMGLFVEHGGDEHGASLRHAREVLAVAARAANVPSFDTPFTAFRDRDALREECLRVRAMGFAGKFAIHPDSVAVINESFAPTAEQVARSRAIVEAYERAEAAGARGSTSLNGEMIDMPVYLRAKDIVARASGRDE
mmetsp:Transcript_10951/g.33583  ORF Transcript_10951/g.33583 Transcript_10951/m.33583 type:complete len:306 (+) Transcript_10951:74-991(+)